MAFASAGLSVVADPLPAAGALKLVSWSAGQWYGFELRPDGQGTYDLAAAKHIVTLLGAEGPFVIRRPGTSSSRPGARPPIG